MVRFKIKSMVIMDSKVAPGVSDAIATHTQTHPHTHTHTITHAHNHTPDVYS